jgi:hypothetical protein
MPLIHLTFFAAALVSQAAPVRDSGDLNPEPQFADCRLIPNSPSVELRVITNSIAISADGRTTKPRLVVGEEVLQVQPATYFEVAEDGIKRCSAVPDVLQKAGFHPVFVAGSEDSIRRRCKLLAKGAIVLLVSPTEYAGVLEKVFPKKEAGVPFDPGPSPAGKQ